VKGEVVVRYLAATQAVEAAERYIAAVHAHDTAAYDRVLTADYVDHGPPSMDGERLDVDGQERFAREMFEAFPRHPIEVQHPTAVGDRVCMRYLWSGTPTGPLMGAEPTGRTITAGIMSELRIEGDRVAEEWEQLDTPGIMQQPGVVPTDG
jgi:predicted ester cyclase